MRNLLVLLPIFLFQIVAKGQCNPDSSIVQQGSFPEALPTACVGEGYEANLTFVFARDTVLNGFPSTLDSVSIAEISTPIGLNVTCGATNCFYLGNASAPYTYGCVQIAGVPADTLSNNHLIVFEITAHYNNFGNQTTIIYQDTTLLALIDTIQANFGFNEVNGAFSFTDSSLNTATYFWDFGDGDTSVMQNPMHEYTESGAYNICLTATNGLWSDTACQTVNLCLIPEAAIADSISRFDVFFTDASVKNPTSWSWDFGDGNTSSLQNPTHQYDSTGMYTVCLIASNVCGADTLCTSVSIVCSLPAVDFEPVVPISTISFVDASNLENTTASWLWDFGDGDTSILQNPTHVFDTLGTYTVCLTGTDQCGADSICRPIEVVCLVADFEASIDSLDVIFTDQSASDFPITSWHWDFGNGDTSILANPAYTYPVEGMYTVCLIVDNGCAQDTVCRDIQIDCPLPTATYTLQDSLRTIETTWVGTTFGPNPTFVWDFDDGTVETGMVVAPHTYVEDGTYEVCLTITDLCGEVTFCRTVEILCGPRSIISYDANFQTVDFVGETIGVQIDSWFWEFGDGNTSSQQNPTHTYQEGDTYQVCLTTENVCGIDTACTVVTVLFNSIETLEAQLQLQAFPNPAQDYLQLTWGANFSEPMQMRLINTIGQTLLDQQLQGEAQQATIRLEALPAGVYTIQVITSRGSIARTVQIVK